jgi:hypothetical protein
VSETLDIDTQLQQAEDELRLAEVEHRFTALQAEVAGLRGEGARILAGWMTGAELVAWLVERGATDADARRLCVEILQERRAARGATT